METKEKTIAVFKNLLSKASMQDLNRETCGVEVCNFKEKSVKRLKYHKQFVPEDIYCKVDFSKSGGYSIKTEEGSNISIFPIGIQFSTPLYKYKSKNRKFVFNVKRKKYNELLEIYFKKGLHGNEDWYYGWGDSDWEGICALETTYAISYGQILRELTKEEYDGLAKLYLGRLCSIDLEFLESKINKPE